MDQQQALKIIVKAQDDASATLKQVQNEAKKTGDAVNQASKDGGASMDDFKGKLSGIVDTLKTVAVTAGVAAIGFGAMFVHSAADLQQTSQSMQVLTGNTQVANKLFGQLATYANNTPFEFPQIAKAGQTLLGFGITSDKVFGDIQMLGDIAAATGADLGSLSLVFSQVNATGKLMGQDALQLINNQIPIFNILGKKMGLTAGEVKQKMEEGAISADLFNSALQDVTKQGGFAFQGTAKLAQTFNGRMSTLSDTFLEFGRNLLGVKVTSEGLQIDPNGVFQKLSTAVLNASESLKKYTPQATAAFGWLIDHAGAIAQAIVAIAAGFAAFKIATFVASAVQAITAVGGIGNALIILAGGPIGLIVLGIAAVVAALVFLQMKFDIFGKAIGFLKPIIEGVVNAFKLIATGDFKGGIFGLQEDSPVIGALITLHDVLKSIADFVGAQLKAAWDTLVSAFNEVKKALQPLIDGLVDFYKKHAPAINNILKILGGVLLALTFGPLVVAIAAVIAAIVILSVVIRVIITVFKFLIDVVINIVKFLVGVFVAAWNLVAAVIKVVADVLTAVFTVIATVVNFIVGIITVMATVMFKIWAFIALIVVGTIVIIATTIYNIFSAILNFIVGTILTPIWNFFSSIFNAIWNVVTTVANAIWTVISTVFTAVWNTIVSIFTGIWNTITGIWNAIYGFLAPIVSQIWGVISGAFQGVWNFISGILGNIWGGITGAFNNVINFLGGIGSKIINTLAGAGKWLVDIGKNMIQGLLDGAGSLISGIANFFLDKLPGWIKEPFKKALGIHSPSKVFAGYGQYLMQGLTNGINGSGAMISRAMANVSDAVSTGLTVSASPTVTANISGQSGQVQVSGGSGGSMLPNVQSSADTSSGDASPSVKVEFTVNGNIIGSDSNLRDLSVKMAQMVQDALKSQGTSDINMLRSTG